MWYKKTAKRGKKDLEKTLDTVFSKYIRLSRTVDGYGKCATCEAIKAVADLDCGHYISRAWRATRWDERNVDIQCQRCNRFLGGVQHVMRESLIDRFGIEAVAEIERIAKLSGQTKKDDIWLTEQIKLYREKIKAI